METRIKNCPQSGDRLAYFGRVSTPKQRLEHHWEPVQRWLDSHDLHIPDELRFEDKIRRHESASFFRDWDKRKQNTGRKRYRFDDMMQLVEAGSIDWIVISNFDRWGIRDKDEVFVFRSKLREYDVGLYAVVDQLNVTGLEDGDFWRVAAAAEGSTRYVSGMADKNIQKMIQMAEAGWATTGNNPFGIDLVLYPLNDLTRPLWRVVRTRYKKPHEYRVIYYTDKSCVDRDNAGFIVNARLEVEREVIQNNMPPRDKKTTGYRYEPSVEVNRLEAVRQMFEMYHSGLEFGAISESLWNQRLGHYDKPFGYHGVETILRNSAYVGLPAWGKVGVGEYRITLDKMPMPVKRKKDETLVMKKTEDQYIFPKRPVFAPIIKPDLFASVKQKLDNRPQVNDSFGKRRTRDKATHPLNGKLFCPDCDAPMVLGSFMPGTKTLQKTKGKAKRYRCFVCGTYRKTIRAKCNANTVRWETLDAAIEEMLKRVADRIDTISRGDLNSLTEAEWLKKSELGKTILSIIWAVLGKGHHPENPASHAIYGFLAQKLHVETEFTVKKIEFKDGILERPDATKVFSWAFDFYDQEFTTTVAALKAELTAINDELDGIASEIVVQRRKNQSMAERLDKRAEELDKRRAEIEPQLVPITQKARATLEQLNSIRETILAADKTQIGLLLASFVERVYPVFDVKLTGPKKKRRTEVVSYRFVPKDTDAAKRVLPDEMKISVSRTGTGSSRPPARSSPGRWTSSARARSSLCPLREVAEALRDCGD
ncbi:MAG: recombinase zinc beta ribbon domain-containing protein [Planctomycetes bacterium]|nr:recombinase zinc beta ribbon domain-containing protein [Planctomycetota bacterium]